MGLRRWFRNYKARQEAPVEPVQAPLPEFPPPHPDQQFGCRTFSQHGDDLIVLAVFNAIGIDRPSYLDIGAHHPFNISNTALLHSRGSRGVNIEANPNLFEAFLEHRPEDVNLNVGIAPHSGGALDFYMVDKWSGRNSFNKQMVEDFVQAYPQFSITEVINIPVMSVQEVLAKHCGDQFPDFLTIDVEGLDEQIIKSIDFSASTPKVICAETVSASGERNDGNIKGFLDSVGYFPLMRCGGNSIFVRNDFRSAVQ